jgi:hypothetical protein
MAINNKATEEVVAILEDHVTVANLRRAWEVKHG